MTEVAIVGVGMKPFGRHEDTSARALGVQAVRRALADAGAEWRDVQFAFGGTRSSGNNADTIVKDLGLTGLPFVNVANGCATGGSALACGFNTIAAGRFDLGIAVGFDQHPRGAFAPNPTDWGLPEWYGGTGMMLTTQFFAMKIQRYMHDHAISPMTLARVAAKAYRNGSLNPTAWRRTVITEDEILTAPMVSDPLTKYMFCHPSDGAVAVLLCRAELASRFTSRPVYLRAVEVRSRRFGSFEVFNPCVALEVNSTPSVDASTAAYDAAGIGPEDVDVAQIQDTEVGAEVMHMAETGLCKHGEQEALLADGVTAIDGRLPINTDGGCLANGEPVAASGLRQVHESVVQLRGSAGARQVPGDPQVALTHVYGAPGISACTILTR